MQKSDDLFLNHALKLAEIRKGFCAPNPSVGAVIVDKDGNIISEGYHRQAGLPHAEINALSQLKQSPVGCTLYVTLEPCCHQGKTPPCTDAIIESGIKRVVYAYEDPNPIVKGKGRDRLLQSGLVCIYQPHEKIKLFYRSYQHWHQTKTPWVTAKLAMSLNGKIAGKNNERIQISCEALQEFTHRKRKQSDAILTTAKTIFFDNPKLNVRYQNEIISKDIFIIDRQLSLSPEATIISSAKSITLFHSKNVLPANIKKMTHLGIACIPVENSSTKLSLKNILFEIGKSGIQDLWVEAGGELFLNLMKQKLLQQAYFYIAPRWINEGKAAFDENINLNDFVSNIDWREKEGDLIYKLMFSL